MKKILIIPILLISSFFCNGQHKEIISIGLIDSIYSEVLNEQRKIWIYLPSSFKSNKDSRYPVLYLLDGDVYFYSLSGIVRQMSSFGTTSYPESVIVAIPNTNRNRDLMPFDPNNEAQEFTGIEIFNNFLEKELIPFIDSKYPTLDHRTLIGHSLGGSFVINTLINHQGLFTNYLAIDPGLKFHDHRFLNYSIEKIKKHNYSGKSLFFTVANSMPEGMDTLTALKDTSWITSTIRSNLNFAKSVAQINDNSLNFYWKYYPNENHLSVATISEYDGLKHFFRWNTLDLDKIIRTNPSISGESLFEQVIEHYRNVTSKLGHKTLPYYDQMNDLGYYFMNNDDLDGAELFFQYNIDNYPRNSNSYDSMGDFLLALERPDEAVEMFKKAIEIDHNPYSLEKLRKMSKSAITR